MIQEFTKYIEAEVAGLSMSGANRNLYAGRRPQSAPFVSAVVEEPFPDPTDPILTDMVKKTFRIECRGNKDDYFSARDIADTIHNALHGKRQITLPVVASTTYLVNIACTEPSSIGVDDTHRPLIILYAYTDKQEIS